MGGALHCYNARQCLLFFSLTLLKRLIQVHGLQGVASFCSAVTWGEMSCCRCCQNIIARRGDSSNWHCLVWMERSVRFHLPRMQAGRNLFVYGRGKQTSALQLFAELQGLRGNATPWKLQARFPEAKAPWDFCNRWRTKKTNKNVMHLLLETSSAFEKTTLKANKEELHLPPLSVRFNAPSLWGHNSHL